MAGCTGALALLLVLGPNGREDCARSSAPAPLLESFSVRIPAPHVFYGQPIVKRKNSPTHRSRYGLDGWSYYWSSVVNGFRAGLAKNQAVVSAGNISSLRGGRSRRRPCVGREHRVFASRGTYPICGLSIIPETVAFSAEAPVFLQRGKRCCHFLTSQKRQYPWSSGWI